MSRSGYSEDLDTWDLIRWRGQVASAIRGKRGQKLLSELVAALEALPDKRLIAGELETETGELCALGAVGKRRGIDMRNLDPDEPEQVAGAFDIAPQLAREIVYCNDEYAGSPEQRYERMLRWAKDRLKFEEA
jgi:hypothetical protein